ncbi:hypothetical protein ACUY4R_002693 [Kosakonia sp. BK9b]
MFCVVWIQQRRVLRLLRINLSYCQIPHSRWFWQLLSHRNKKCVNYRATSTSQEKGLSSGCRLAPSVFRSDYALAVTLLYGEGSGHTATYLQLIGGIQLIGPADGPFPLLLLRGYPVQAYSPPLIEFFSCMNTARLTASRSLMCSAQALKIALSVPGNVTKKDIRMSSVSLAC